MPYLYRQAVLAHEEGVPMMRPMFVEFPKERSCESLDKQYMLGDSLLIAPIFKESGEVEYYLPQGKWFNILTNQVVEGGAWQKEVHNYFTMPMLLRPNSILAVGNCETKPDYDYSHGVTLYLSVFEDGGKGQVSITDKKGTVVMTAKAQRRDHVITLEVEGGNGDWSYRILQDETVTVECKTQQGNEV